MLHTSPFAYRHQVGDRHGVTHAQRFQLSNCRFDRDNVFHNLFAIALQLGPMVSIFTCRPRYLWAYVSSEATGESAVCFDSQPGRAERYPEA